MQAPPIAGQTGYQQPPFGMPNGFPAGQSNGFPTSQPYQPPAQQQPFPGGFSNAGQSGPPSGPPSLGPQFPGGNVSAEKSQVNGTAYNTDTDNRLVDQIAAASISQPAEPQQPNEPSKTVFAPQTISPSRTVRPMRPAAPAYLQGPPVQGASTSQSLPPTSYQPGFPMGGQTAPPSGPPSLGHQAPPSMPGRPMPPLMGAPMLNPSSMAGPSVPGQPSSLPGQPPLHGQPPITVTAQPTTAGRQHMGAPRMSGPPMTGQNIPGQPMAGQQMPGPPMAGHQIPGQPPMSGPPMMGGQPPMAGQHTSGQFMPRPPLAGQSITGQVPLTGPPMPGPMSGPPMSGQPMPGRPMGGRPPMGGQPMTGQPPMPGQMGSPPKRIDPNQMPNPIQVMNDDQNNFEGLVFSTSERGKLPPLVSTNCRIQDDGNCSPRFMRSTVYTVPCNQDMLKESGIPMSMIITPFAKIPDDEVQICYVDHGPSGPVRCNRCKAYMNPFMQFIDGGRRFVCNICSHSCEVPPEYFCHLDHQGRRVDMYERPELCYGSYEFIATTDYCKEGKPPQPPAFIFLIDVSYQSVQRGMLRLLANELNTLLDNLPKDVGMDESLMKVGFMTYNTQLHFYNVKGNLAQPQMMVVTDLEEGFLPLLDGFLVRPSEAKAVVESLLELLPDMFVDTRETEVLLGPAIVAGTEALKCAGIGGKLLIFHSSLPMTEAPGKLKNREDRKLLGTDKEKTLLGPQGSYYMDLAKECTKHGIGIDMFLFPNAYCDVATLGLMASQTGGQMYRYSYFKDETHGKQFIADLKNNFSRQIGFDAIMRLRCSTGLRPVEFFGSFIMENTTDIQLATIDSDKSVTIEIKHDDKIPEDGVTFMQCALLYTSAAGQRRLRIHNMSFSTCSQLADLYRNCELDTMVNYLAKHSLRQVLSSNPQSIKEGLIQRCVQILACYRQHCATPSTSGQLILPECMKLLPLYTSCLIKSDVLSGGQEMSSDDRSFLMQAVLCMPPKLSSVYFYPRVIQLHDIDTEHEFEMPSQIRCLSEKFLDSGVYLLENGISIFIWVGLQVDAIFLQDVFGASGIGQLDIEMTRLPELDNPLSQRVREVVDTILSERTRSLKLTIVRQRDKLEPWFKHYLVEDKGFQPNQLSYVDFLCHVHKEIRNLLS